MSTKTAQLRDDLLTPKTFLVLYSKILFDGNYKKANEWLKKQDVKMGKSTYYEIIRENNNEPFKDLAEIGKNYLGIVAEMGVKLRGFERAIIIELQKKKPNPIILNGYATLMRLQPLLSAYDKQVKRLLEKGTTPNESHLTI